MCRYINFLFFNIPSYGLCLCVSFFLSGFFILKRSKRLGIVFEDMIICMAVSCGSALACGALLYIGVTFTPSEIIGHIAAADFSFILNAGLVFYGALIGGIVGAFVCIKIMHINTIDFEKSVIPFVPLGHSIGRIGCMLAGCCYGFEYQGIFAVENKYASASPCFPVQAVEALCNIVIMCVLLRLSKRKMRRYDLMCSYLLMYSVVRFLTEFLRGDVLRGIYLGFSTSQWISAAIACLCIFKFFYSKVKYKA